MVANWVGSGAEIAGAGLGTVLGIGLITCAFCMRFTQLLAGSWTSTAPYRVS